MRYFLTVSQLDATLKAFSEEFDVVSAFKPAQAGTLLPNTSLALG